MAKRLPVRMIDASGTLTGDKFLAADGSWKVPTPPIDEAQITPGASGQVLTSTSANAEWIGNVVVLIPAGGSVPPGTPIGAIIMEKDA